VKEININKFDESLRYIVHSLNVSSILCVDSFKIWLFSQNKDFLKILINNQSDFLERIKSNQLPYGSDEDLTILYCDDHQWYEKIEKNLGLLDPKESYLPIASLIFSFISDTNQSSEAYDSKIFKKWFFSTSHLFPGTSKGLEQVYLSRKDLLLRFKNDNTKVDFNKLAQNLNAWFEIYGTKEYFLDLMDIDKVEIKSIKSKNYVMASYFNAGIGIGNYAKNLLEILNYVEDRVVMWELEHVKNKLSGEVVLFNRDAEGLIIVIGLDEIQNLDVRINELEHFNGKRILVPFWEIDYIPLEIVKSLSKFDEIWAPTKYINKVIAETGTDVKLRNLPILPKKQIEISGAEVFRFPYVIMVFDLASDIYRKGVFTTINAFREIDLKENQRLVIKTYDSSGSKNSEMQKIKDSIKGFEDKIVLIDDYWDHETLLNAIKFSKGYISLHSAEGLGLSLLDALALKTPIVATKYGGVLDFLDDKNSFLVDYTLEQIPFESSYYFPNARWAQPNMDFAKKYIKLLFEDNVEVIKLTTNGKNDFDSLIENSKTITKWLDRNHIYRSSISTKFANFRLRFKKFI
jgi:glycosyltransferase involved in cell wall biosynthesis